MTMKQFSSLTSITEDTLGHAQGLKGSRCQVNSLSLMDRDMKLSTVISLRDAHDENATLTLSANSVVS